MVDLLLALLEGLSLMDSRNPSTWAGRHPQLFQWIRIVVAVPIIAVLFILLITWVINLGPTAQKIVIAIIAMQLTGLLVLLLRKRDPADS
ncbi:hypothetical protein ALO83_103446 [Pseudomonas cannabina pv. alisalensis]|uniref:Uncharacterized protein n=1 Tax=Pseudomonas cannabina TaxID=86840 RepID=A0A3M3QR49_PSECA|nr:hypothetical protein [Pseudomonas cannabina]KPW16529.1 hypothetical protein ALO83_103446 [Pseudomonas cannabina pv. alisalensis]RMN80605.1 hypothetical protein ALQ52_02557 [Pseudomonas cannabina pv. alisalensis]RMN85727.1 hypothetical protein ALQ53_103220 [Pseudomonas cannabina]RMN86702.1 hypothetical protein ALQ51_101966 [Pseudomonas cannabina]